jgi:hypothetical protein
MDWIPTNKTTGIKYPPVSDDQKRRMEQDPHTQGKYSFEAVKAAAKPVSAAPTPAKKEERKDGPAEDK